MDDRKRISRETAGKQLIRGDNAGSFHPSPVSPRQDYRTEAPLYRLFGNCYGRRRLSRPADSNVAYADYSIRKASLKPEAKLLFKYIADVIEKLQRCQNKITSTTENTKY
jgi:hypothetical protein